MLLFWLCTSPALHVRVLAHRRQIIVQKEKAEGGITFVEIMINRLLPTELQSLVASGRARLKASLKMCSRIDCTLFAPRFQMAAITAPDLTSQSEEWQRDPD